MKYIIAFFLLIPFVSNADTYSLGSSYLADAFPYSLEPIHESHLYCGKSLQFIRDNPQGHCWLPTGSPTWDVALPAVTYNHLVLQPVDISGITIESDRDNILYWWGLQAPTTTIVIHATWPIQSNWDTEFLLTGQDFSTQTNRSRLYYYVLLGELEAANPSIDVILDRSNEMLNQIKINVDNGVGPINDFEEMFRDASGHSSQFGQYLHHNALRQAVGQPTGVDPTFPGIDPTVATYLDGVVAQYQPLPEAPLAALLGCGILLLAVLRLRRS